MAFEEKQRDFQRLLAAAATPRWKDVRSGVVKYDDDWRFSNFELGALDDDLVYHVENNGAVVASLFDSGFVDSARLFSLFDARRDALTLTHASSISKGVAITAPTASCSHVRLCLSGSGFFHMLVVVEENAKLDLSVCVDALSVSSVVEAFLGSGSILNASFIEGGRLFSSKNFSYSKNASSNVVTFASNAATKQFHNHFLNAPGASAKNYTACLGKGSDVFDLSLKTFHSARNTSSDTVAKASLSGNSSAVFRGGLDVSANAQGSIASLFSHALLFDNAFAKEIPSLDVRNNDVQAAHGASSSSVADEDLFYAQSRGLDAAQAKKMFTQAFLAPILQKASDNSLAQKMEDLAC